MNGLLGFPLGSYQETLRGFPKNEILSDAITPPISGYTAWYDASDVDSVRLEQSPDYVIRWKDKSGSGYDLTQGNLSYRPSYGDRKINGIVVPNFYFSGVTMVSLYPTDAQQWAGFSALEVDGSGGCIFGVDGGSSNLGRIVDLSGSGLAMRHYRLGGAAATSMSHSPAQNLTTIGLTVDANQILTWQRDKTKEITSFTDTAYATWTFRIGNRGDGADFTGGVGEIIFYDRSLDQQEFDDTMSYLSMKWGTP